MQWMIYGANGYTGELIAREAVARGWKPVLAGRSRERISQLAHELDLPARVFPVTQPDLDGIDAVLHCAGPFSATSAPMIEACLQTEVHYLDITGEISVFEHAHQQHDRAASAGVVLCPGVGFDVIPTDCVAAALHRALPEATHLALGFDTRMAMSPGTSKTGVELMAGGGKIRQDGKLVTEPIGSRSRRIDFGNGEKPASTFPWGDVATAYYTTGIPNIEVYVVAPRKRARMLSIVNAVRPLLRLRLVQRFLQGRIGRTVTGPDAQLRAKTPVFVWGEARDGLGQRRVAHVKTANGYDVTVTGSLAAIDYLSQHQPSGGYYTPSQLLGSEVVTTLPGSGQLTVS